MCGFCGILRLASEPPDPGGDLLDRMTDILAHRGPDDRGIWRSADLDLGHRRLSVIDLSRAGRQPMSNEDGTVLMVYNGEIYNFRELKEAHDLAGRGHIFRSRTDTEVLVHLFEELGIEMVHQLNGMFAMGIWDSREGHLYLIRDRYGIKPLFYHQDDNHFRFASEIKALLADPRVPRKVNLQAMHDFLTFDYVPGTQTAFEGIHEVPPAHWMSIDRDGSLTLRRYWDLPPGEPRRWDESELIRDTFDLLDRAVQRRLVADVPIGVLLSGGMDSSALVALMNRHVSDPIRTYSVGFVDSSFDERPAAQAVSRNFGTVHQEVVVTPDLVRELLPLHLSFIDEPYADGSAIPTYLVSGLARNEVVVLLSGEGGDEVFAGYDTYAAFRAAAMARRVPFWLRRTLIAPLVRAIPVSHRKLSLEFRLKRFLGGLDLSPTEAHVWWRVVLTESQKRSLYAPHVIEAFTPEAPERHVQEVFDRFPSADALNGLLHADAALFLPDDLMIKNDRMTMAHSLEARVPFTDHHLSELLARVPSGQKMPGFRRKHLMKEVLRGVLPPATLRRRKIGLEMPYSRWLAGELQDLLRVYLGPSRIAETGLLRPEGVTDLVRDHMERRHDNGRALWGLLSFMIWHEQYIGG